MKIDLTIDEDRIEESFDKIANDLLKNYALFVNKTEYRFTEIEFYYFNEIKHPDKYTHEHNRDSGEWRFHNQGIDLTFQSSDKTDGGILIRGILKGNKYVNGPRKVLGEIFQSFGKAFDTTVFVLKPTLTRDIDIYKTYRYLPNKGYEENYHKRPYRYLTNIEELDIPSSQKTLIKEELIKL